MTAVYGTQVGMSVGEISVFVGIIYVGGMLLQFPIGWMSDRMDRRLLIIGVTLIGAIATLVAFSAPGNFTVLLMCSFVIGGGGKPALFPVAGLHQRFSGSRRYGRRQWGVDFCKRYWCDCRTAGCGVDDGAIRTEQFLPLHRCAVVCDDGLRLLPDLQT